MQNFHKLKKNLMADPFLLTGGRILIFPIPKIWQQRHGLPAGVLDAIFSMRIFQEPGLAPGAGFFIRMNLLQ